MQFRRAWPSALDCIAGSICLLFALIFTPAMALAADAGMLVSADPVADTPPGQQAWRIRYGTTDGEGRAQVVTGMVIAPREAIPRERRKVIAWTHATWGVAEKCAPSLSDNFFTASPALSQMIAEGYVVVAPDYPGLGTNMVHPYLVGEDTARSVLDAVRAALSIPGAASGTRFAVWGESQGGHAALWTGMLARSYAPGLTLVGTAAAAHPPNLPPTSSRLRSQISAHCSERSPPIAGPADSALRRHRFTAAITASLPIGWRGTTASNWARTRASVRYWAFPRSGAR